MFKYNCVLLLFMRQKFVNASVWKRIFAWLVDMAIINIVLLSPFSSILDKIIPSTKTFAYAATGGSITIVMSAIALIIILYFTFFEYLLGQSLGKMLFNIYVVSDNGLKFWQALVRNILYIPIIPFVFIWVLDPMMMIITGRRLSEIATKTRTVQAQ